MSRKRLVLQVSSRVIERKRETERSGGEKERQKDEEMRTRSTRERGCRGE